MSDYEDRVVGTLKVRIDRTLCVGFGDCVEYAPDAFRLDHEDIAVFVHRVTTECDRLVQACDLCPVDALLVWDEHGNQLVP